MTTTLNRERYYILEPTIMNLMYPGIYIENWEELTAINRGYSIGRHLLPGGKQAGLPAFPRRPKLELASKRRKTPPGDIEEAAFGIWLVSDRFKQLVESVDPDAFEFEECDISQLTFQDEMLVYWACGIRRFGSFLDEANSLDLVIREDRPDWRTMIPLSKTRIAIDRSKLGRAHLFSLIECFNQVICDEHFKRTCKAAKLRGLRFTPT